MTPEEAAARHNACIGELLRDLVRHGHDEVHQWLIIESLALGVGLLHGRTPRETAEMLELMAERIVTGQRKV